MLCIKNHRSLAPSRLLSAKGHVRIFCSLVNAFATKISHYQPFAVKSVISTRTKEKPTPRGGFFFGYMMEDSNRGSYTRRKPRARHFFLVYYLKRNAVSCQARHVVAGFAELATIFLFHKQIIFINKSSHRFASPLLLSAKGHARIFCSLVNAFASKICRCQPYADKPILDFTARRGCTLGR